MDYGTSIPTDAFDTWVDVDQRGSGFTRLIGNAIDIGAFELQTAQLARDYNRNGTVDAADYVMWRKTLGTTGVAPYSGADGDGNSSVQPADYDVWGSQFGETLPLGAGSGAASLSFAEAAPNVDEEVAPVIIAPSNAATVESRAEAVQVLDWAPPDSTRHDPATSPSRRTNSFRVVESVDNHLLLLLATDCVRRSSQQSLPVTSASSDDDRRDDDLDEQIVVDEPIALALSEWF